MRLKTRFVLLTALSVTSLSVYLIRRWEIVAFKKPADNTTAVYRSLSRLLNAYANLINTTGDGNGDSNQERLRLIEDVVSDRKNNKAASETARGSARDRLQSRLYKTVAVYELGANLAAPMDLMPKHLRPLADAGLPVTVTAEEFRKQPKLVTGNPLIDTYGDNDPLLSGEQGRGVSFVDKQLKAAEALRRHFQINVMASDVIPLNRMVPDSRLTGCEKLSYEHDLPAASVIIPFYDEWPSILLRTVYSIVVRTPRHLVHEIILVDDHSTMAELGLPLDQYVFDHFPRDLVRIVRMPKREGLIRARMEGWKESKGEVVIFFDSHMEVNVDWIQPLLTEIKKDRHTVPMAVLDYVQQGTFEYKFNRDFLPRYGFNWPLGIFETLFRDEQIQPTPQSPRLGAMMIGAAFAMDRAYFAELGGYDMGMQVWGGENLEMSWRVWLCGGRLVHLPCSHLGHIARSQPYTFPKGRRAIETFNYKRAIEVWMGDIKQFVYDNFPEMETLDVGDLSERIALKEKLQCRNFTWYMDNVWPELLVYNRNVTEWGSLVNNASRYCLDNEGYLFPRPRAFTFRPCNYKLNKQGFSLTKSGLLRTTLQCVVFKDSEGGERPRLEDCLIGPGDKWEHTEKGSMVHVRSQKCMDQDAHWLIMRACSDNVPTQRWVFTKQGTVG